MTGALAVPPLYVKNGGGAVNQLCMLNRKNTVTEKGIGISTGT